MKKVLLTAGLVALASSSFAGSFDGMYAGARLDHAWTTFELEDKSPNTAGNFQTKDAKPKGLEVDLLFGQGFQNGDTVYGFEAHIGRGLSDTKKSWDKYQSNYNLSTKARRLWKFGASGRWGKVWNNALVYARLGLHANQYESKISILNGTTSVAYKKTSFFSWAIAPGAGVEFNVAQGINARFEYTYEHSFTQQDVKLPNGKNVDINEPKSHILSLGVTFAL